ncbi:MAG: FAD:protein FMN transferase [Muribaculaceae bacterium]|nr:FAD:protein FMN transferase [Muribaculaceae bacterium]
MNNFKYSFALLFYILCVVVTACDSDTKYTPRHIGGVVWGTSYSITYDMSQCSDTIDIDHDIAEAINIVDVSANTFDASSQIAQLNNCGVLEHPTPCLLSLLHLSEEINHLTGGAFDPTVAPLVNLWGFGPEKREVDPSQNEIDSALCLTGLQNVEVTSDRVYFRHPGMLLDFSAIAKGLGVDYVAMAMDSCNIRNYIVEIGGELRAHGHNPSGEPWTIQLDAPIPDRTGSHTRLALLRLNNAAVATSGNYRNFRFLSDGTPVYHTISPTTGRPVLSDVLSATVISQSTAVADALATACMVLGLERATRLIEGLADNPLTAIYGAVFVTAGTTPDSFEIHPVIIDPTKFELSTL